MRGIRGIALVLLLAGFCNAISQLDGTGISPSHNPIVEKYHSTDSIGNPHYIERNLIYHALPGLLIGGVLFILCCAYFTNRWCGCCDCLTSCCKKKDEGLYRSRSKGGKKNKKYKDAKKDHKVAHPVVSAILRIVLVVFFLASVAGIAVGIVGSTQYHTSLVSTLQKLDDKANSVNATLNDVFITLDHLQNVSGIELSNETREGMIDGGQALAETGNKAAKEGTKYDSLRNMITMAVYVAIAFPLLMGLLGAIVAKGKLAYCMSFLLPLGILAMWIVFSFHYMAFVVNVDTCYAINNFLDPPSDTTSSQNADPINFLLKCDNSTDFDTALDYISDAMSQTQDALTEAYDDQDNETIARLQDQYTSLSNVNSSVYGLVGCTAVTDILTSVYTQLCGGMVESSLYLWQTQVCLAVALTVIFVIGIVAEYRIGKKKKEEGYNPLLNLNDDE